MSAPPAGEARAFDVDGAVEAFSSISRSLIESYEALSRRARVVEEELAKKIEERDAVARHLEAVLQAIPVGVVVRDASGGVECENEAARRILGGLSSEVGARLVVDRREARIVAPDGRLVGTVEVLDDRTEVTELTERMHAMDKMAALGTMAAGIAHEIRNPLNAVAGFARLLLRELPADEKHGRRAARIVEGTEEANSIVAALSAFASPERLRLEECDASEVCASAVRAALPDGGDAWRVSVRCGVDRVVADRVQVRQALRNLVANAVQAQPAGGAVELEVERSGETDVFRVLDAGPGVPPEIRGRVLDPFFTTRAEGTGLGLALVAAIARLHGGDVQVSPAPSRLGGAEVSLRIPTRVAPAKPAAEPTSPR